MKTFTFDERGNLTVLTTSIAVVGEGEEEREVEQSTKSDISPGQLAVHLPMLIAEMSPDELLQAQAIIKGLVSA